MTNDQEPTDSTPLPAPVTGVARGGHGTGTALDDTQLYDVSDFTPVAPAAAAPSAAAAAPPPMSEAAAATLPTASASGSRSATPIEPHRAVPASIDAAPVVAAPAAAAATARPASRTRAPYRTATPRRRRVGAPVAGLAGFALAAGLAILVGVVLGGVPMPDGAAAGGETPGPTQAAPLETDAPDREPDNGGSGGNGGGNGNGNNGNGNGNGRGNGNDDD